MQGSALEVYSNDVKGTAVKGMRFERGTLLLVMGESIAGAKLPRMLMHSVKVICSGGVWYTSACFITMSNAYALYDNQYRDALLELVVMVSWALLESAGVILHLTDSSLWICVQTATVAKECQMFDGSNVFREFADFLLFGNFTNKHRRGMCRLQGVFSEEQMFHLMNVAFEMGYMIRADIFFANVCYSYAAIVSGELSVSSMVVPLIWFDGLLRRFVSQVLIAFGSPLRDRLSDVVVSHFTVDYLSLERDTQLVWVISEVMGMSTHFHVRIAGSIPMLVAGTMCSHSSDVGLTWGAWLPQVLNDLVKAIMKFKVMLAGANGLAFVES